LRHARSREMRARASVCAWVAGCEVSSAKNIPAAPMPRLKCALDATVQGASWHGTGVAVSLVPDINEIRYAVIIEQSCTP